jgi:cyanophycin synthetase
MMQLHQEAIFSGPSPYALAPVVLFRLEVSGVDRKFRENLLKGCLLLRSAFPGWIIERPSENAPLAESIARCASLWALGALNEVRGYLHDAGAAATPDGAFVWIGYHDPAISRAALEFVFLAIEKAGFSETDFRSVIDIWLDKFWLLCKQQHPDYQARILMQGARNSDIPFRQFLPGTKYWQFGWGCRSRIFMESTSNADSITGYQLIRSKALQKKVYECLGFPSPGYVLVNQAGELQEASLTIGFPCVVKPLSEAQGRGVTVDIRTIGELESAFDRAKHYSKALPVMVERFIHGQDFRITVINGKFFATTQRIPVTVTGNGLNTVRELLESVNHKRSGKNPIERKYMMPVPFSPLLEQELAHQSAGLDSVPGPGKKIRLIGNANLSIGGISFDVTEKTHPHIREMAEIISKTLGIATLGIDYITGNIDKSWCEEGSIIETNIIPGLDIMISGGLDAVSVGSAVLGTFPSRIPFQLIILHPSALDEVEAFLLKQRFDTYNGWTCKSKTAIGNSQLLVDHSSPWAGVNTLLRNKEVQQVCAVCSSEEIFMNGMPVDKVDHLVLCGKEIDIPENWMGLFYDRSTILECIPSFNVCKFFGLRTVESLETISGTT